MLGILLALLLSQPQTLAPETKVSLVLTPDRVEYVTLAEGQREFAELSKLSTLTDEQRRRYSALVKGIGPVLAIEQCRVNFGIYGPSQLNNVTCLPDLGAKPLH